VARTTRREGLSTSPRLLKEIEDRRARSASGHTCSRAPPQRHVDSRDGRHRLSANSAERRGEDRHRRRDNHAVAQERSRSSRSDVRRRVGPGNEGRRVRGIFGCVLKPEITSSRAERVEGDRGSGEHAKTSGRRPRPAPGQLPPPDFNKPDWHLAAGQLTPPCYPAQGAARRPRHRNRCAGEGCR